MSMTYANDMTSDGAGSQVQRIIGIVALADALGVKYDHSPIIKIDYHGWDLYLNGKYNKELPKKWNTFLGFPETERQSSDKNRVWNSVAIDDLSSIAQWIKEGGQARIALPYPFLDNFPQHMEKIRGKLWAWYDSTPKPDLEKKKKPQVAIHVRRGELHLWESDRMLPNKYYLNVIRELKKYLPADAEFHVHSEGSVSNEKGKEEIFGSKVHSTYMQETSKRLSKNRDHFEDFLKEGCILHINEDIFQTFHQCVSADIYIMSKSSLSYVMGVYSRGIVVYQPFWHNPLPSWQLTPPWHTIRRIKDILTQGPKIAVRKLQHDRQDWDKLRNAYTLHCARELLRLHN